MIFRKTYSDDQLIVAIKRGGPSMEKAMRWLYRNSALREEVGGYLMKIGAPKQQVDDIWQDGICALILNIREHKFREEAKIATFLHAICKNIWLNQANRAIKLKEIKGNINTTSIDIVTPEAILLAEEEKKALLENINLLGDKCREILELWSLSYSMAEIAQIMKYKSSGMARKKKHQCLQRLIEIFAHQSSLK